MTRFAIRRAAQALPLLLVISVVVFGLIHLVPGGPLALYLDNPNVRPADIERLRRSLGLDRPLVEQYFRWLWAFVRGDWGYSYADGRAVAARLAERLPATLELVGASSLVAFVVALPVGVLAGTRPYSIFDQIANTLAFVGFSLPTFFTGLLILLFSVKLDWLPMVYRTDISSTGLQWLWDQIKQSIMPVMVLGLFQGASLVRYVRSSVLDVVRLDYVTTARSKGIGERAVITRHIVRTALIPVVTLIALQLPVVFSGAIVTEQIFRVPGIGSLLVAAMLSNDTPVVMAITFVFSCLVVLFNLLADVLYGWLDPRISYR